MSEAKSGVAPYPIDLEHELVRLSVINVDRVRALSAGAVGDVARLELIDLGDSASLSVASVNNDVHDRIRRMLFDQSSPEPVVDEQGAELRHTDGVLRQKSLYSNVLQEVPVRLTAVHTPTDKMPTGFLTGLYVTRLANRIPEARVQQND